jgi:CRP-like cAMP-binding protein
MPLPVWQATPEGPQVPASVNASRNLLFSRLPAELQATWTPLLRPVQLTAGQLLLPIGQSVRQVCFPVDSVISLLAISADGFSTMLAMVGREGVLGLPGLMSGEPVNGEAVVLNGGWALTLDIGLFVQAFEEHPAMRRLVMRYMQAFVSQIGQTALCNRFHAPEEQLCTYLLRTIDRKGRQTILVTHDQLGKLIGVRRETISLAAARLQQRGVLTYHRGHIHVPDRAALEQIACGCYAGVENVYRRAYFDNDQPWGTPEAG